jgi:hypothetical protein
LVSVTVEVPGTVQAVVADVPVIATGKLLTVIVAVLFVDKVLEQDDELVI